MFSGTVLRLSWLLALSATVATAETFPGELWRAPLPSITLELLGPGWEFTGRGHYVEQGQPDHWTAAYHEAAPDYLQLDIWADHVDEAVSERWQYNSRTGAIDAPGTVLTRPYGDFVKDCSYYNGIYAHNGRVIGRWGSLLIEVQVHGNDRDAERVMAHKIMDAIGLQMERGRPAATRKQRPLCGEASIVFPLASQKMGAETGIAVGRRELAVAFERAIEEYNGKHRDETVFLTEHVGGTVPAMLWLFSSGGTTTSGEIFLTDKTKVTIPGLGAASNYSAQSFVFLPKGEADAARGRGYKVRAGTEPALAEAIRLKATNEQRKLGPGDVLALALEQRSGNMREALLLAHNTLRSVARDGDAGLTGVDRDPKYYSEYLTEVRAGDNAGPWYHLFGTAFFELQSRGDLADPMRIPQQAIDVVAKLCELTDRLLGQEPGKDTAAAQTMAAEMANLAEQIYREYLGGNDPDPAKYCFNVWGAQVAAWLRDNKLRHVGVDWRSTGKPVDDFMDAVSQKATDTAAAVYRRLRSVLSSVPTDPTTRKLYGFDVHVLGSPVDAVWTAEGRRLVLDQLNSDLSGDIPAIVIPKADPVSGTWQIVWIAPRDMACSVNLTAVAGGDVHLLTLRPDEGKLIRHQVAVQPGAKMTATVGGDQPPVLRGADGTAATPTVVTYGDHAAPPPHRPPPADLGGTTRLTDPDQGLAGPTIYPRHGILAFDVRYEKPGTILDTVGIARAEKGSFTLRILDDGKLVWQVFDPGLTTKGDIGNGWQAVVTAPLTAGEWHTVLIVYGRLGTSLEVDDVEYQVKALTTPLSGQPFYLGDFPGDDIWAGKYRTAIGFTGEIRNLTIEDLPGGGNDQPTAAPTTAAGATPPPTVVDDALGTNFLLCTEVREADLGGIGTAFKHINSLYAWLLIPEEWANTQITFEWQLNGRTVSTGTQATGNRITTWNRIHMPDGADLAVGNWVAVLRGGGKVFRRPFVIEAQDGADAARPPTVVDDALGSSFLLCTEGQAAEARGVGTVFKHIKELYVWLRIPDEWANTQITFEWQLNGQTASTTTQKTRNKSTTWTRIQTQDGSYLPAGNWVAVLRGGGKVFKRPFVIEAQ